jgi:nanoRNase/pAp phosphatase (c-di-AMP/oligoRNAs hydrolase)
MTEDKPKENIGGSATDRMNRFGELVRSKNSVLIFTHDFPDPDAIGGACGLKKLIEDKFDKPVVLFGVGFSRPQNKVMVNVLNISLKDAHETFESVKQGYLDDKLIVFVDVNENSGNLKIKQDADLKPNWTIDHHIDKEKPLNGPYNHLEPVGSACTIVAEYLEYYAVEFDEEKKQDADVATAMMMGLMTDTDNLLSMSATPRDHKAFEYLKARYSLDAYKTISDFELSPYYFELMFKAHQTYVKDGSLIVLNLGYIREDQEGAISFIAELWRRWKDVRVVVAFAVINNTVTGRVRMKGAGEIGAADLARQVFKAPDGGGHGHMAGATAKFGPFFETDLLDEETKAEFLHVVTKIIVARAKKLSQE